jgi:molybdopterin-guanine dinucleotide biosynthesis protein A
MGRPKAWLPFGGELMLQRVVRVLREVVEPVVVVAAPGQDVPELPAGVEVVRDEVEGRGPLAGLAAGLAALAGRADAAYLSSCDVPFLTPGFVRRMVRYLEEPNPPAPFPKREGGGRESVSPPLLGEGPGEGLPQAAVPRAGGFLHPLAAVYRASVLPAVSDLLAADRLRPVFLFDAVPTRVVGPDELADVDPHLHSLRNLNTPEEYAAALAELEAPRP